MIVRHLYVRSRGREIARYPLSESLHGAFNHLASQLDPAPELLLSPPPRSFAGEELAVLQQELASTRQRLGDVTLGGLHVTAPGLHLTLPHPYPKAPALAGTSSSLYLTGEGGFRVVRRNPDYKEQMDRWVKRLASGADPNDPSHPEPQEYLTRDFPAGVTLAEVGQFAPDIVQSFQWMYGPVDPALVVLDKVALDPRQAYNEVLEAWESALALATGLADPEVTLDW